MFWAIWIHKKCTHSLDFSGLHQKLQYLAYIWQSQKFSVTMTEHSYNQLSHNNTCCQVCLGQPHSQGNQE